MDIDRDIETVTEFVSFYENWFAIVFGSGMDGDALVFSTGKAEESHVQGLHAYKLSGQFDDAVIRDVNNTWTELSTTVDNDTIALI